MPPRVVLLGDTGVGKTSICRWLESREFDTTVRPTIGGSFTMVTWRVDGTDVQLQLWDTAGQERFRSIAQSYYRDAQAAIVVFSLTDEPSFESVKYWTNELENHSAAHPAVIVLANKADLPDRAVTRQAIEDWQRDYKYTVWETSVATESGLQPAFDWLVGQLADAPRPPGAPVAAEGDAGCC
jgi:small GTP-binding protein